jgi:hypothetical protein
VGSGNPTQVPEETVSSFPVVLIPETAGFEVAKAGLETADVEAVNSTTDPREFVAVMREIKCFPTTLSRAFKPGPKPVSMTETGVWRLVVVLFPS